MKHFSFKLPTMAAILGLVALIGTAATSDRAENQQDSSWLLDEGGDPTNPEDYQFYSGNIENECPLQTTQVCGIKAPEGAPDEPDIDAVPGLMDALDDQNPHPSIFSRP